MASGYGITNLVERSSARADELTAAELIAGGKILEAKIARLGDQTAGARTLNRSAYAPPGPERSKPQSA